MKRILLLTAIPLYLAVALLVPSMVSAPTKPKVEEDERVLKLSQFLQSHNSPLAPYAHVFIEKADAYGLPDWKLVPAISGVESTFGKRIPYNSYNAYGWANGAYSFNSWEESIDTVSKTLKQKYYNRGADTVEEIAYIYAPPSKTWARNVRFFMGKIENWEITPSVQFTL